ncbi:MAG: GAF domain-containing sensor histidine kinase [Candidatus Coatesbacteria bacterium]|nr:GAF domain-containing sensor histidine kinase [Candidatus Coatesbacteria bacterium]
MGTEEQSCMDEMARLRKEIARLEELTEINQRLHSSLDMDNVLKTIIDAASRSLEAERSTLYVIDEEKGEIWSHIAQGDDVGKIRLKIGQGIAGHVAKTGEVVRIPDAHKDNRFNPNVDAETGFVTRSMLCVPLESSGGKRVGVLQILNKKHGLFSEEDVKHLNALAVQAALALQNAQYLARLSSLSKQNAQLVEMLEQRLQDLQNRKMVSMKHLARGIAHEVNNQLAKVKGGAESLPEDINELKTMVDALLAGEEVDTEELRYLLDEGIRLSVEGVMEGTSGIAEIVQRIRNFVRLDQEAVQFSNLNDDIEMIIGMCSTDIEETEVTVKTELGDLPEIECRPREINMLLRELLWNAIYYASDGKAEDAPKLVLIKTSPAGDGKSVTASFLDNGPGIPVEDREHIFDLFYTTKPEGSGTGLGLSESYAIATRNGGTIFAEDPDPKEEAAYATKLTLRLPIRVRSQFN